MARITNITARKGKISLQITLTGVPDTRLDINSAKPTGGVVKPISRFIHMMTPK